MYAVDPAPLEEVDLWLERYRGFWDLRLDALGTELARGKRDRRPKEQQTPGLGGQSRPRKKMAGR